MTDKLKLVGEPEAPPQPTFPSTQFQITDAGVIVNVLIAPGLTLTQGIGEQHMNELCKQWLQSRKQIKQQLEMIRDIERSKLH